MVMISSELIAFENKVKELWEAGELPYLLHLCGGNETELLKIFRIITPNDYVLSTHRNHYHYLLKGGNPDSLLQKIKAGNSMFVFDRKLNFISDSIVAGNACIAAGIALALQMKKSKQWVFCFVGDGAEDEGHFYEAVKFVEGRNLPCTFIIEDNNRSVETESKDRYNFNIEWPSCVSRYNYKPTYPHAGSGTSKVIKFK